MTILSINPGDPTPPFEQVRKQLAALIESGELAIGQRLPTVRQLASDLGVAPGTVSRAFKELESAGYVETRRAAGTRVRERPHPLPAHSLEHLARTYVAHALADGASEPQIVDAVRYALNHARINAHQ